jgi:hypothetical protein
MDAVFIGGWKGISFGKNKIYMMRGLLGLCIILTMILPVSQGAVNPVPVVSIRLDTASQNVNVTANSSAVVQFTGQCGVDKLPIEKVTVQLTSSVDKGWSAQVNPSSMLFTSTTPQSFTCTVTVPAGTPQDTYGKLTVTANATTNIFRTTTHTDALIAVNGPAPVNQTGNATNVTKGHAGTNQTTNGTGTAGDGAGKFLGMGNDQLMMAGAAVVILLAAATAGAFVRVRRARRAVYDIDSADDG